MSDRFPVYNAHFVVILAYPVFMQIKKIGFTKIEQDCHQNPRWQVDKEAIGKSPMIIHILYSSY